MTVQPVPTVDPAAGWYRLEWGNPVRTKLVHVASVAELNEARAAIKTRAPVLHSRARLHTCAACAKLAPWDEGWSWYGSYADIDDGKPVAKFCSDPCRKEGKRRGLMPRNARWHDET